MALSAPFNWRFASFRLLSQFSIFAQFRSDAALEAIRRASENRTPNLVLYNYPSFSGAYGALFAHLYHSRLNLPCLILPFSVVVPFRYRPRWLGWEMEESRPDLIGNLEKALLEAVKTQPVLAFIASESREFGSYIGDVQKVLLWSYPGEHHPSRVIGFDHRKSVLSRVSSREDSDNNLTFYVNIESSSSTAAYEYFSAKLSQTGFDKDDRMRLLNHEDHERVESILKYIEDGDLRRWSLPDIKAFNIGLREWRSKLNCITNSCMYQQLLGICSLDLITRGRTYLSRRHIDAKKLLHKVFRVRLGRGFYGECLGIRADGSSDFTDEIGKELSRMSAEAGLRPIGAVTYMQHNNLKMCLRTIDSSTDTSEIAKAYGGGGSASSSSFIIRMDEYNQWLSMQSSPSR